MHGHAKRDELLCSFHEFHNPKNAGCCLPFGGTHTGKISDNNRSKPHVTFKFMDTSHEFAINKRFPSLRNVWAQSGWLSFEWA